MLTQLATGHMHPRDGATSYEIFPRRPEIGLTNAQPRAARKGGARPLIGPTAWSLQTEKGMLVRLLSPLLDLSFFFLPFTPLHSHLSHPRN